jgi:hypothetical protein
LFVALKLSKHYFHVILAFYRILDLLEPEWPSSAVATGISGLSAAPVAAAALLQRFQRLLERPVPQRFVSQHAPAAPHRPWTVGLPVQHNDYHRYTTHFSFSKWRSKLGAGGCRTIYCKSFIHEMMRI